MKIFNFFYYLFISTIFIIAVLLLVSVFPVTGNYKILAVLSGSMEPNIRTGSIVVVAPAEKYQAGDIITFSKISKTQTPVTHRIKEVKNTGALQSFVTKGDANNAADIREVRLGEVVGKVRFSVPYIGYAINTAKKPYGFLLIIIVPALLVIYDEIKKIRDEALKIKQAKKNDSEQSKIQ